MTNQQARTTLSLLSIFIVIVIARIWASLSSIEEGAQLRVGLFVAMGIAMLGFVFFFPKLGNKATFLVFLAVVLASRVAFLGSPLSDDVNRYLWEGKLVANGGNPYSEPAAAETWETLRDQYWEGMNHRERLTAYPPGMLWLIAAGGSIAYHPEVFRWLAIIGDILTCLFLGKLLLIGGKPLRWLGFYVLNPVVLVSFAAEGHLDSWMVAGTMGALLAVGTNRWRIAWTAFGLAIQFKLMVMVIGPLFLLFSRGKGIGWLIFVLVVPTIPFWEHLDGLWHGLLVFGEQSSFNGGGYELLRFFGVSEEMTRKLLKILFLGVIIIVVGQATRYGKLRIVEMSGWLIGWLLVCSPIVHFWYLTWVIPFVCFVPRVSWLALSIGMAGYFFAWTNANHGSWGYPPEWTLLVWAPFFLLAILDYRFLIGRIFAKKFLRSAHSIDVVVPVLRANDAEVSFFRNLKDSMESEGEVFVVAAEAGAMDSKLVEDAGCKFLCAPRGRGQQIAAGVSECKGDLVAIAHADTCPEVGWVKVVRLAADRDRHVGAWVLGQRFDHGGLRLRFIEAMNESRAMFQGTVFGDQTIIIRRELLDQIGGFPKQPLMEDIEISLQILHLSPIEYLGLEWSVSAEKWNRGFIARFFLVIQFLVLYRLARLFGRDKAIRLSERLYQKYYHKKS